MAAFLLCSHFVRGHGEVRGTFVDVRSCNLSRPLILRREQPPRRVQIRASASSSIYHEDDDGGDGFFGGTRADMEASLGIAAPDLTVDEIDYLASAKNDDDRLDRLKDLARRKNITEGVKNRSFNCADDYMAGLSRKSSPVGRKGKSSAPSVVAQPRKPIPSQAMETPELQRKGMNAGELYINDLSKARNAARPEKPPAKTDETSEEDLEGTIASINALEVKLNALAGQTAKDDSLGSGGPIHPPVADDPTLDKQITFLEEHLARLKAEDAGAGSGISSQSMPSQNAVRSQVDSLGQKMDLGRLYQGEGLSPAQSQGWGGGPAEMSREERLDAFDEIRRRRAELRKAEPVDPLAVSLPDRRSVAEFGNDADDGPGELTEAEIQAKLESARNSSRELAASRPVLTKPPEHELRLALIALRIEHDRYCQEVKHAQEEHEQNIRGIFQRYVPDLE